MTRSLISKTNLILAQGSNLDILKKTQGEKTQNSTTQGKNSITEEKSQGFGKFSLPSDQISF